METNTTTAPAPFRHDTTLKLGTNRGNPRVWIEGKALAKAGFRPGVTFSARFEPGKITLEAFGNELPHTRKVSGKSKPDGSPHPIIDINAAELARIFPDVERIGGVLMTSSRLTPIVRPGNAAA